MIVKMKLMMTYILVFIYIYKMVAQVRNLQDLFKFLYFLNTI